MATKKTTKQAASKQSGSDSKPKTKNQKLQEKMFMKKKSSWHSFSNEKRKEIMTFTDGYKKFLDHSKTERACTANVLSELQQSGFKDIAAVKSVKPGDKVFKAFKNKSVMAVVIGKDMSEFRLVGSHMDSPRLDLKPWPLFEDAGLAQMKSHYYGGLKKYQWVNTPLSMHGLITTKEGKEINIVIGEKEDDPKFLISDLLPHLAKDQMGKTGSKVVEGEEMTITLGSIPVNDEDIKEQVKFTVLKELFDNYGIIEEDFAFAELQFVPSAKTMDIGLDRGLVAGYGQDDKVCVYTSLQALIDMKAPQHTALGMFVDKEEIGSMGNTGAASMILHNFAYDYKRVTGISIEVSTLLENSQAISADVTAAVNPNFKGVHDETNASLLGYGVSVEKYGGGGGKYSTNDAHGEYMARLRRLLDGNSIAWQTGEMGKLDLGGGGTIAMFLSRYGMDCVDAGPSVLAMHSPMELTSKADIYSSYEFYKAFFDS
ncbi:MAG: aminopeptidase [Candidatus Woesearchaeota archaeon]